MAQPLSNLVSTLVFVPLVGFLLYRRVRRTFGRQPLTPRRMILRVVLLAVICGVLLASSPAVPALLAASTGAAIGVALALVGLRHTTFEVTPEGKFYTPNKWLGLAVTALVLGRLAARFFTVSERMSAVQAEGGGFVPPQPTTLTLGLLFLMAGYYVAYYIGVLMKVRAMTAPIATSEGLQ